MPEQLLYEVQIASSLVNDCCRRVPERVEPSGSASARNPKMVEDGIKDISPQNVGVKRRTVFLTEDEVLRRIVIGVLLLGDKRTQERGPEVDCSDAPLRLGRNQLSLPKSVPDLQGLRYKIEIFPLQTQEVARHTNNY